MKKFRMMAMALMAVAMCANFASCSNDDVVIDEPKDEYVTVKLGCGGEILDIKNTPLSRADGETVLDENDLLLLTITEIEKIEDEYGDVYYNEMSPYAYAILGYQSEDIALTLLKGRDYRIRASVIVDGVDSYTTGYGLTDGVTSNVSGMSSYDLNRMHEVNNGQYEYDRFYGMVNDFRAGEVEKVNVELYRVAYAAEFSVNDGELGDVETLEIKVARYNDSYSVYDGDYTLSLDNKATVGYRVKTMNYIEEAMFSANNDYSEIAYVTITWNKNIVDLETGEVTGTEVINMGTYEIPFKRNHKTRITIKPQDLSTDGAVSFTAEGWGEDIYFEISDGQLTQQ